MGALDFKTAVLIMPLFAAVLWAVVYVVDEQLLKFYSFSSLVTYTGVVTMLLGIAWAIGGHELPRMLEPFTTGARGWTFFLAILGGAFASVITWTVIKYISPTYAAVGEISYPVFVPIFAYFLYREKQWDWPTIAGGTLIMIGLLVMIIGRARMSEGVVANATL